MYSAPQSILNQGFFEDQDMLMSSQLGIFPFHTNLISIPLGFSTTHVPLKSLAEDQSTLTLSDHQSILASKKMEDFTPLIGESQILSLQKSSENYRAWGDDQLSGVGDDCLGVSTTVKMKKMKGRRRVRDPRFCFKTMSDTDVLDDGYKWRKYGQKVVKNTQHPRSYYKCTQDNCRVKKRVERLAEDPRMVITTYEGRHIHSPSHDQDDHDHDLFQPNSTKLNNFFW